MVAQDADQKAPRTRGRSVTAIGTSVDGFESMPARLVGERAERIERASKLLQFHVSFLDDYLRGILPNDLVLIGAPTGMGKTDLALSIATSNALGGRKVHYFALEAEPRELERRTKYALISRELYRQKHPQRTEMNYTDWLLGKLEHVVGPFNHDADQRILDMLAGMQTYYRGAKFTAADLQKSIESVYQRSELIIVDHLHYIDSDDENEHRALGNTVKTVRDVSLRVGTPIVLVAHLRKRDQRAKQLVASLDDFHGSSNITKIATQAIAIERAANIESPKWYLSPTFVTIPKDRRSGSPGLVSLMWFDRRTRGYATEYTLGKIARGSEWEPLARTDVPSWAKHHTEQLT